MQSNIDILNWSRWVFVNYVPGSFGSFLTKVIENSPSVAGIKGNDFFNEKTLTSHSAMTEWIKNWHHGDEMDHWLTLSCQDQRRYLIDNINRHLLDTLDCNSLLMHRLSIPVENKKIMSFWPNARSILITVDNDHLPLVIDQMVNKTFDPWAKTMTSRDSYLAKVFSKTNRSDQKKFYRRQCESRIKNIMVESCDQTQNVFPWPVSCFLEWNKFQIHFDKLSEWLGIEKVDSKPLYEKFYTLHQFGEKN